MMIAQANYKKLLSLDIVNSTEAIQYMRSESDGFMDLVVERVPQYDSITKPIGDGDEVCSLLTGEAYSLAHYFTQNDDLMKDPEMVILVRHDYQLVEALTFEMSSPLVYDEVYLDNGHYNPGMRSRLNSFLRQWLINLKDQGHGKCWIRGEEA